MNEITSDIRSLEIKDDFYPLDNTNIKRLKEIYDTALVRIIEAQTKVTLTLYNHVLAGMSQQVCKRAAGLTDKNILIDIASIRDSQLPAYLATIKEIIDETTVNNLFSEKVSRHDIPTLIEKAGVVKCQ